MGGSLARLALDGVLVCPSGPAGAEVEVVRNDAHSVADLLALHPEGIVLSPGPGRPEGAGVCVELLQRRAPLPLLGARP